MMMRAARLSFVLFGVLAIHISAMASTLPDTGQQKCYDNYNREIQCPQPGSSFYGQDGNYSGKARKFTDNSNGTITDNATNIIWQKDLSTGKDWAQANAYCAAKTTGGLSWRLPTRFEAETLVDLSQQQTINSLFSTSPGYIWTSTTDNSNASNALGVTHWYGGGSSFRFSKTNAMNVRCVSGQTFALGSYVDNGDGTVTDTTYGFMWQKTPASTEMSWANALMYCENLNDGGHTDWRLPNKLELESLVMDTRSNPSINTSVFNMLYFSPIFHTSSSPDSTNQSGDGNAFTVLFNNGETTRSEGKSSLHGVRCVRMGLASLEPTELQSGQYQTNLSFAANEKKYFKLTVPEGKQVLLVASKYGHGDVDLYMSRNTIPTVTNAQYASVHVGNNEHLYVESPAAGDYYILANAKRDSEQMKLVGAYGSLNTTNIEPNTAISFSSTSKTATIYTVSIPSNVGKATFKASGGSGDLYIIADYKTLPLFNNQFYSTGSNTNHNMVIEYPAAGTWYFIVYAQQSCANVTLDVSTTLQEGQPKHIPIYNLLLSN